MARATAAAAAVAPEQEHDLVVNQTVDEDGEIYHSFAHSDSAEANDPEVTFIQSKRPSSSICYEDKGGEEQILKALVFLDEEEEEVKR